MVTVCNHFGQKKELHQWDLVQQCFYDTYAIRNCEETAAEPPLPFFGQDPELVTKKVLPLLVSTSERLSSNKLNTCHLYENY